MDIDTYCSRIGYAGPRTPKFEVLQALALRHPLAIPFENVSVVAGGVPDLSIDALQAKLVRGGRGGYCYEQNSLLQSALIEIGFTVTGLSARVRYRLRERSIWWGVQALTCRLPLVAVASQNGCP